MTSVYGVAKHAKLSVSTESRALHNDARIPDSTRLRVRETTDSLNDLRRGRAQRSCPTRERRAILLGAPHAVRLCHG